MAIFSQMPDSIQGEMEIAMSIFKRANKAVASGRTDSGVHAHKMIAHFDI